MSGFRNWRLNMLSEIIIPEELFDELLAVLQARQFIYDEVGVQDDDSEIQDIIVKLLALKEGDKS